MGNEESNPEDDPKPSSSGTAIAESNQMSNREGAPVVERAKRNHEAINAKEKFLNKHLKSTGHTQITRTNKPLKRNVNEANPQINSTKNKENCWRRKEANESDNLNWRRKENNFQKNKNFNNHKSEVGNFDYQNSVDFKDGQKQKRKRFVGFKKLQEIYEKDPELITIDLQNADLETVLSGDLSPDFIVLIVKILAKVASSYFIHNKYAIVNLISSEKFLNKLSNYITELYTQTQQDKRRNQYFWREPEKFFNDLFIMCHMMIDIAPSLACDKLEKVINSYEIVSALLKSKKSITISEETNKKFNDLKLKFDMCVAEQEKRKNAIKQDTVDEEPPEDFRELSVYPLPEEVISNTKPFVRENVIKGPYKNVEHYLDIQFRLLKEDFVAPLRKGICDYREFKTTPRPKNSKLKNSSVKVHEKVYFLYNKTINDQVGVVIQLSPPFRKQKRKLNFESSRQFMYGSLMCFTRDNFATLIFGKILERSKELFENDQLIIGFEKEYNSAYEFGKPYTMIESKVYFEPYYHVLMALQDFDPEHFPMEQYFIYVNPGINPPLYLLPSNGSITLRNETVPILNNSLVWSDLREKLCEFDDSQFNAFRSALTEEFVVIQGPPGTGKTYLGLKIAEVLLENKSLWDLHGSGLHTKKIPMLVVCFTNHALDQFLEGLLQFTTKIVRVGGQSKNGKLKNYSLREQKRNFKVGGGIGHALYEKRQQLANIFAELKVVNETIDRITKNDGILSVASLWRIDNQIRSSWFRRAGTQEVIDWFFGGRDQQRLDFENQDIELLQMQDENEPKNNDEADLDEEQLYEENYEDIHADDREAIEMDFLPNIATFNNMPEYILNTKDIENIILDIENKFRVLSRLDDPNSYLELQKLHWDYFQAKGDLKFLKEKLKEGEKILRQDPRYLKIPEDIDYNAPANMKSEDRWNLYYYWITRFLNQLFNRSKQLQQNYSRIYKQYAELKDIENLQLLRTMDVVGMTTTGAARLQTTLQSLKCRIVIVEEAAEVLESHIVVSLTRHCEHLLLIGDHQQLRPSTADFHTETKYKLGISLFERMVMNNMHLNSLRVQHRMRPEIASLIVPAIYPELENHKSVLNYPQVVGIDSSLFFINHTEPEGEWGDSSKMNDHEAKYLIQLARYLVLNGYEPEDITILAAYSGQMFNMFRERRNYGTVLSDVRITVLDNYQGEECKIILLSLVRNNSEGKIGFLKIENRVCVALSRAKEGFYIMGNMQLLCNNSRIWPKIKDVLEKQNALGSYLTVRCQIHPDQVTQIEKPDDFNKVPEGGCFKMCNALLNCGHNCKKCCHLVDRNHENFRCTEPCSRILCDNGHQCPKKCYEECGECLVLVKRVLNCQHEQMVPCYMDPTEFCCKVKVDIVLPCGHKTVKDCYIDPGKVKCPSPCEIRIEPCGHACVMNCHTGRDPDHLEYKCTKPCAKPKAGCSTGEHPCQQMCYEICKPCEVIVLKKRTKCTHAFDVQCSANVDDLECRKPCKRELPCGHKCKKTCSEPCNKCFFKVEKVAPCSHTVKIECYREPTRFDCTGKCTLPLPCGHQCQNRCNQECTVECKELVKSDKPSDCGHIVDVPCHLRDKDVASGDFNVTKYCSSPCGQKLECGHQCHGTCGTCAQGRIHVSCSEKCEFPLICGHVCKTPCRSSCPPCEQKCTYSCLHSKCPRKCGQPCVDCREPCPRRCKHQRCNKYCGLPCSVRPCTEPCPRSLPCGHDCIGFCGDPCPHLCRICDKEELTSIILSGNEEDEDARFVELLDCRHVIENEAMERWLSTATDKVGVKTCPHCNCPITTTLRYSDHVKKANRVVTAVKQKCVGNQWQNDKKRKQLLNEANDISVDGLYGNTLDLVKKLLQELRDSLLPNRKDRRNNITAMSLDSIEAKLDIIKRLLDKTGGAKFTDPLLRVERRFSRSALRVFHNELLDKREDAKVTLIKIYDKYAYFLIERLFKMERMPDQTRFDFNLEITRFNRIIQLAEIVQSPFYGMSKSQPNVQSAFESARKQVFICKRWTDDCDAKAKEALQLLNKEIKGTTVITDEEKRQINRALGMAQGHWFACPNGHPYVIGDCGGANQVSRCPQCKAQIGGTSHRLLPGNRLAPEMDGARYPAWSDAANMGNYQF